MADVEIATLTVTHRMDDDDTWLSVDKPDGMGLVEALGMLELAKAFLLEQAGDDDDDD